MKCPSCNKDIIPIINGCPDCPQYKCSECGFNFDFPVIIKITPSDQIFICKVPKHKLPYNWNETFPKKDREPDTVNKYAWKMVGKAHVLVEGDKYSSVSEAMRDRLSWVPED